MSNLQFVGAHAEFVSTEVFAAATAAPVAYTDLDLSAVVGAREALVLLEYYNGTGANRNVQFRTNGIATSVQYSGVDAVATIPNTKHVGLIVKTDTAGIVEWQADANTAGATIKVKGYIYA